MNSKEVKCLTEQNRQALRHDEALIIATHVIANYSEAICSVNEKHKGRCFGASNLFKRLLRSVKLQQVPSPTTRSDVKGLKSFSPLTLFSDVRRVLLTLKTSLSLHASLRYGDRLTSLGSLVVRFVKGRGGSPLAFASSLSPIRGFSLAEVLITLGVIGVVSAMTMPILINNFQNQQYVVSLKKAYAQFNQILQKMTVDNETIGCIKDYFGTTEEVGSAIASYYNIVKNCGTAAGDECFAVFDNNYDGSAGSTTQWSTWVSPVYKFITTDGMSFAVYSWNNRCTLNRGFSAAPDSPTYNATCGVVIIDVNGLKKPNYFGRDVFQFYITSNKTPILYPAGGFYFSANNTGTLTDGGTNYWNYQSTRNGCSSINKSGIYCTGRILEKGWDIDY